MNQKTVLIIDDSATIRRLVDRSLTAAGYRVVAAATAEDGIEMASAEVPDLILLDHQLPGTTGTEVASQLLQIDAAQNVPVVVSSTLRKKAYAEYMELSNVVDMLPKPYTEELLATTVENALSTAAMVVSSQSEGTAVPEVLQQGNEPDMSGKFDVFGLREVLDFLNNSKKTGVLEVEGDGQRVFFYVQEGRVNGVSASGISTETITSTLPESLENLAPIVKLTVAARAGSDLDGLVELLNRKVVDSRLLRKLLRHQAASLTWLCFAGKAREFRFTSNAPVPPLFAKLPLEISVLALLIEGAQRCDTSVLDENEDGFVYVRRAIRGQNLDRSGVSAHHMKMLNILSDRHSAADVAQSAGCSLEETTRVLAGMVRAELVERTERALSRQVVVFQADPVVAGKLRESLGSDGVRYDGKVVRDRLALQLVLRRGQPDAFVFDLSADDSWTLVRELQSSVASSEVKWLGLIPSDVDEREFHHRLGEHGLDFDGLLAQPYEPASLFAALDDAFEGFGAGASCTASMESLQLSVASEQC